MISEIFSSVVQVYNDVLAKGDPRMVDWPMMGNPFPTVALVICYLGFIKYIGPMWMRHRKPFDLSYLMVVYNFALVAASAWMFARFSMLGWLTTYSWSCQPIDYSNDPDAVKMAQLGWYFFMTKFIELGDTVFFVLRKKENQISTLHLVHHSFVPITLWFGIKYGAGGYNSLFAFLNTFVHIWMYAYYGIAALGPAYKKYLWWKKYITVLQLIQFSIVFFSMLQLFFFPTCAVSQGLLYLSFVQSVVFFGLFLHFFIGSYNQKNRAQKKKKACVAENHTVEHNTVHKNGIHEGIRNNNARVRKQSLHNGTTPQDEDSLWN